MSEKANVKIAFAKAVLQQLWVEGLISQQERERIARRTVKSIAKSEC